VPPKPNALTPARRTPSAAGSNGRSSVFTANGPRAKSMFALGRSKCRLGGITFSNSASVALSIPAAPAAALRWPMLDFTEPSATDPGASPAPANASVSAWTSATSPTRVEVPCPSMRPTPRGETPAFSQARSIASLCPTGLGAVMPLPRPSLAPPMPRMTA